MSNVGEMFARFTLDFFGLNEKSKKRKIIPKAEFEDVELGNVVRKLEEMHMPENYIPEKSIYCEFKSILQNPDLELGFGPIVEFDREDIFVDMNAFEKCKIYENYVSFMECISYLATPLKDRSPAIFKDIYPTWNTKSVKGGFHVVLHIQTSSMGLKYV